MNKDEARSWLRSNLDVPRETWAKLEILTECVIAESTHQNLIAASTISTIWTRHIVDSAQLLLHANDGPWIDFGSGAGFPGLVIVAIRPQAITLIESRRKRADFLSETACRMGVDAHVTVVGKRVELVEPEKPFAVISARAFAPLDRLFELTTKFSTEETRWVLPKGRSARDELAQARRTWQGEFRVEPSVTDPEAGIIVATGVRSKSLTAGNAR